MPLVNGNAECKVAHSKSFHPHCKENPIYVFPEKELHGLSPNFHIYMSASDLYILKIDPHIFLQRNRQTDPAGRHMNVEIGTGAAQSFYGNICFEFSVLCLLSAHENFPPVFLSFLKKCKQNLWPPCSSRRLFIFFLALTSIFFSF